MSAVDGSRTDPLRAAIEAANQQEAQENMLRQVLSQAFNQPMRVTQITGPSLIGMVDRQGGGKMLMVAQANGDRWDIPLEPPVLRSLLQQLADEPKTEIDQGTTVAAAPEDLPA
jgi:hypothetical protein